MSEPRAVKGFSWRRAIGWLLGLVLLLWRATFRIRFVDGRRAAAGKPPYLHAIWHAEQLTCIMANDDRTMVSMASRSKDGDFITGILDVLGVKAARGSSSRGGAGALLEIDRWIKGGHTCALTVDGPRGPRHSVKPGILRLAQRLGKPVVPGVAIPSRVWRARSWDRFEVPLPFSKVTVIFGDAIHVAAEDSLEQKAEELKAALEALGQRPT